MTDDSPKDAKAKAKAIRHTAKRFALYIKRSAFGLLEFSSFQLLLRQRVAEELEVLKLNLRLQIKKLRLQSQLFKLLQSN